MTLSFRDCAAIAAVPALIENYPTAKEEAIALAAFDIADAMEAERRKRSPEPALSFSAGDSDLSEGLRDPADESLGPLVGIERDIVTRVEGGQSAISARDFDLPAEQNAGETGPYRLPRKEPK